MPDTLFLQNVIAIIWDFDNTLIPGYMQQPLFERYNVVPDEFWREVKSLPVFYESRKVKVSPDTAYLSHILTYVQDGTFKGLTNKVLEGLGPQLTFFEGLPDFLPNLKAAIEGHVEFKSHDIRLEHYIVSRGLKKIIEGNSISGKVDGVWGCEFIETPAPSTQAT